MVHEGRPQLVVVVEDDDAVRRVIERILTRAGYAVEVIESGVAALERAESLIPRASLWIVDAQLPRMRGMDLRDELDRLAGRHLPVLITSGHRPATMPALRKAGVYLPKPFTARELLDAVELSLHAAEDGD